MIAAVASNGVIGKENALPWHIGADMKHFKQITTGHAIVMGRKTFESIGRALPNRRNIVLSRTLAPEDAPGCEVVGSVDDLDKLGIAGGEEVIVIGGAQIYKAFMPMATTLYITHVQACIEGDASFPQIGGEWEETERESHPADDKNDYPFSFVTYRLKKREQ